MMVFKGFNSKVKDVENIIRRLVLTHGMGELSLGDQNSVRDMLSQYCFLLEDLLPHSHDAFRRFGAFLGMSEIDVLRLGETMKFSSSYLRTCVKSWGTSSCGTLPSFKRKVKETGGYWGFLAPISELLEQWFEEADISAFKFALQWCDYGSRLNLRSLNVRQKLIDDYIAFEEDVSTWSYPDSLCQDLNKIVKDWLSGFNWCDFEGRHGPGAVAEANGRIDILSKYQHFYSDPLLKYFYKKHIGVELDSYLPLPSLLGGLANRTCKVVFVPKSIKTFRTISKEPVGLQFTQQGIARALGSYIRSHPVLRNHIKLEDADFARQLAWRGSIMGEFDTIDLSNASDSISLDLVKRVFRGTPVLSGLLCSRSSHVEMPDGTTLRMKKFAPMGSATCFPVETLIFAAITELAVRRTKGSPGQIYSVYGDDIIVPNWATGELLSILAELKFSVNVEKSFYSSQLMNFRESCGGEYVNSIDVTPLRISRRFVSDVSDDNVVSWISARIDAVNSAFEKGYFQLRRYLLLDLKDRCPTFVPYFSRHYEGAILTFPHVDEGFHLTKRWSMLHRLEGRCDIPSSKDQPFPSTDADLNIKIEHCALYEWLRSTGRRPGDSDFYEPVEIPRRKTTVPLLKRKWVPLMR